MTRHATMRESAKGWFIPRAASSWLLGGGGGGRRPAGSPEQGAGAPRRTPLQVHKVRGEGNRSRGQQEAAWPRRPPGETTPPPDPASWRTRGGDRGTGPSGTGRHAPPRSGGSRRPRARLTRPPEDLPEPGRRAKDRRGARAAELGPGALASHSPQGWGGELDSPGGAGRGFGAPRDPSHTGPRSPAEHLRAERPPRAPQRVPRSPTRRPHGREATVVRTAFNPARYREMSRSASSAERCWFSWICTSTVSGWGW